MELSSAFDMTFWVKSIEYWGLVVFALSGIAASQDRPLDIFGVSVVAGVTAMGGGTLRDILLNQPVYWLTDFRAVAVVLMTAFAAFFLIRHYQIKFGKWLVWFDAIGLAVFTIFGMQKALSFGLPLYAASILGVITGVAGGAIRDLLVGKTPLIMQRDLYATSAFSGTLVLGVALWLGYSDVWILLLAMVVIFVVRMLGIVFNWHFPRINEQPQASSTS